MKQMLLSLVSVAMSVVGTLFRGLAIQLYWGWFVLPLFKNMPALPLMGAVGISFMVGMLSPLKSLTAAEWNAAKAETTDDRLVMGMINTAVQAMAVAMGLLGGYIWHLFM